MIPMSIIGLFCEDIRVEKNDILTLIGLLPDNVNFEIKTSDQKKRDLATDPNIWNNRLCIYARANFDPADPVEKIDMSVTLPNKDEIFLPGASPEVINRAKEQAKARGGLLAGVIMRAVLHGNVFSERGLLKLEAIIGSERRLIAFLNFQETKEVSASSAS